MGSLREVSVRRWVTCLKEDGALPTVVRPEKRGLCLQATRSVHDEKTLVAELIGGEIARGLGRLMRRYMT